MAKYKYSDSITADHIAKFVDDFAHKKLEKYLKTEDIPESQPDHV